MLQERFISGKNINLRDVDVDDAEFILNLRTNEIKSRYLHKTIDDIELQKEYLRKYKDSNSSWYFIIDGKGGEPLGTVRIYDIQGDSFCWGSWLTIDGAPKTTAIESALLVYEYTFNKLGFAKSHFDVRKSNTKVVDFHKRFGAHIVGETEVDYFFTFDKTAFELAKKRYSKFFPT